MRIAPSIQWLARVGSPLSAAVLASLLVLTPVTGSAQRLSDLGQDPLAGSSVFGSKGCVKCHAVNGLGGKLGPDLGRIAQRRSYYELAAAMWNHLPVMGEAMRQHGIQRPQMSPRESGDLIAFLFTLDYFDPPGDVERGQRLFTDKRCVVCHQVGVYGGVIGPSLDHLSRFGSPILVASAMWNHGPTMAEQMEKRGIKRPTFEGTELIDLIAYLESAAPAPFEGPLYVLPGRPQEGRVIFTEKACVECHSIRGVGGRVGPDLAEVGRDRSLTEFAAAMWNKAPLMIAAMNRMGITVPQLGAGEMADLVAYLYSLRYFAESGEAESGSRLLRTKGCLACHAVSGRGGSTAVDLANIRGLDSAEAVLAALWNHSALMEAGSTEAEARWPRLNAEEMANLAAFLQEATTR